MGVKWKIYVGISFGALFHIKDECVTICISTAFGALDAVICYCFISLVISLWLHRIMLVKRHVILSSLITFYAS